MLSKKFSDMIFIGVIILIIVGVFVMRIVILNVYDSDIERFENEILDLEAEIARDARLIVDNRHDQLPSMEEMAERVPTTFNFERLEDLVYGMVSFSGIHLHDSETDLFIGIGNAPAAFTTPSGNAFNRVAQDFDIYRITISFNTNDLDDARALIENFDSVPQLFAVQSVEFYQDNSSSLEYYVEIVFVTFYQK